MKAGPKHGIPIEAVTCKETLYFNGLGSMIVNLEIKTVGDAVGIILPPELLARLQLELGDTLVVSEGPDRSVVLSRQSRDDAETFALARQIMRDYAETFRILAK